MPRLINIPESSGFTLLPLPFPFPHSPFSPAQAPPLFLSCLIVSGGFRTHACCQGQPAPPLALSLSCYSELPAGELTLTLPGVSSTRHRLRKGKRSLRYPAGLSFVSHFSVRPSGGAKLAMLVGKVLLGSSAASVC